MLIVWADAEIAKVIYFLVKLGNSRYPLVIRGRGKVEELKELNFPFPQNHYLLSTRMQKELLQEVH
jgi:hypothetical protein